MNDRTPFVVGLLAIVAVVAWLLLRGETAQPAAQNATPPVATPKPPPTPVPSLPPTPQAPSHDDTFTQEPRDDAWAKQTEAELATRWKQIRGGTLESVECRKAECRLIVTGARDALAGAIADLEGPRGLHGFAKNVLLSNPTVADDGTVTLRIYARFER